MAVYEHPDQDYDMWGYWMRKHGPALALKDYYPGLVKDRTDLQGALVMIENGERIIKSIMRELVFGGKKPNT